MRITVKVAYGHEEEQYQSMPHADAPESEWQELIGVDDGKGSRRRRSSRRRRRSSEHKDHYTVETLQLLYCS